MRRGEGREGGREGSEGGVSARTAEILKSLLLMTLERLWEGERREGMELRRLEETRGKEGGEGGREGGKKGEINCVIALSCYVAVVLLSWDLVLLCIVRLFFVFVTAVNFLRVPAALPLLPTSMLLSLL